MNGSAIPLYCRLATPLLVACLASACDVILGTDDTPPLLSVPMIDMSDVAYFFPFGGELRGPDGVKLNVAYEMVVNDTELDVVAVSSGKIDAIERNDDADFEIRVKPSGRSIYLIIYDHVKDLRVSKGEEVSPGTLLGTIGFWSPTEGRIELQINQNRDDIAVCPRDFGTAEFNAAHDRAMVASMEPASSVCLLSTVPN